MDRVGHTVRAAEKLIARHRFKQAVQTLRTACSENPQSGRLRVELASALAASGDFSGATETYFDAFEAGFHHPLILTNLGSSLFRAGRMQEAIIAYREAIRRDRNFMPAWSNLLLALNCLEDISPRELAQEHWRFGDLQPSIPSAPARRLTGRLRIGYVSASFKRHSVAQLFEPVLRTHDRERFQIFCYQANSLTDAVTRRLIQQACHWRFIAGLNQEQAIEAIKQDDIDFLVDLDGHTGGNRLPLFAAKPARILITWLGYPNTTGLSAMDYRITDSFADPAPFADELNREKLIRLDPPFLTFAAPRDSPPVSPAPVLENGYVTFGMFNQVHKLSDGAVSSMAQVLLRVERSRLVLQCAAFADGQIRDRIVERFVRLGIDEDRISCHPAMSQKAHLEMHRFIDIMLDTFPYTGTTTTCESLWMGVPVVTLLGSTHRERVSASLLQSTGFSFLIAGNPEQYVSIAADLASSPARIVALRDQIRPGLLSSRLMDNTSFTQRFENALVAVAGIGSSPEQPLLSPQPSILA